MRLRPFLLFVILGFVLLTVRGMARARGGQSIFLPVISLPGSANYCPAYVDSHLYRPRVNQVIVNPSQDWVDIIENAADDTEILLQDGTYQLNQYGIWTTSSVTIRSVSGNRSAVVIQGQGYGTGSEGIMLAGPAITVADVTLTGMRNHAISVKGSSGADDVQVYNVHLYDIGTQHLKVSSGADTTGTVACSAIGYTENGVQGDYINAIDIHRGIGWHIRDNYIYNIWGDGTGCEVDITCGVYQPGGGPAILVWNNSADTLIERNQIIDSYRGIALGLGNGHNGGIVRNNFFYQSMPGRPGAQGWMPGDMGIQLWQANDAYVAHNTLILGGDYPGAIELMQGSGHTILNNLITKPIWDRGNVTFSAAGNITDATVADLVAPGDVHLPAGSRAIGAGVNADVLTDIDGEARGNRFDVGADHVASGS